MTTRSYSAGRRKTSAEPSSVVRVYERRDLPGFFMTMAWDTTHSGRPHEEKLPAHLTWEQACALADELAAKRRVRILGGIAEEERKKEAGVTVGELYRQYLESAEASDWSDKHRGDHHRARDFWTAVLGADTLVPSLSLAQVEKAARDARKREGFSPRWEKRKLALIRAATRWGHRKAKLYPTNPLDGLEMPEYEPETDRLIYSEADTARLVEPHPDVDWRVTLAVNIAVDTGRRISAILSLTTDDVIEQDGRVAIRFRKEFDKGRRGATVPVSSDTAALLGFALEECRVMDSAWLFPEGRLDYDDPRDASYSKEQAIRSLHEAERTVGVEWIPGRAYHGLKRRHITTAMEVASGDSSLVGDLTGNRSRQLVEVVYRKQSRRRLEGHVDAVRGALRGAESTRESTRAETAPEGDRSDPAEPLDDEQLARVDSNHHRRFQRPETLDPEAASGGVNTGDRP